MIFERIPATVTLMGAALIVTIVFSLPIGIIAAVKQYSSTDKIISAFATIGYALPSFLIGHLRPACSAASGWRSSPAAAIGFPLFGRQSLGKEGDIRWTSPGTWCCP